jgi:phage tail P2-like protein
MAKQLLELSLLDIIPSSIADDTQVLSMTASLDPELEGVTRDIREALIISRIDELPEEVIDLLAWQWHVDFYDLARTIEMKRETVKSSIAWHRKKGTVWAIKKALEMLGVKAEITEWWKIPGAIPYTFNVAAELTDEYWRIFPGINDAPKVIRQAIMESKATRSWLADLDTFTQSEIESPIFTGIVTMISPMQEIMLEKPTLEPKFLYGGIASYQFGKKVIDLPKPLLDPVTIASGIGVAVASIITVGKPNGPRPPFDVWPVRMGAGAALFCGSRITIHLPTPRAHCDGNVGIATFTSNYIKIKQEV